MQSAQKFARMLNVFVHFDESPDLCTLHKNLTESLCNLPIDFPVGVCYNGYSEQGGGSVKMHKIQ